MEGQENQQPSGQPEYIEASAPLPFTGELKAYTSNSFASREDFVTSLSYDVFLTFAGSVLPSLDFDRSQTREIVQSVAMLADELEEHGEASWKEASE